MTDRPILAKRLQQLRIRAGLTQRDISEDLGPVSSYESGSRTPKLPKLIKLAKFYGVSTDYLLGVSDYETPEHLAASEGLELTADALNYLHDCNDRRLVILNLILSTDSIDSFLDSFGSYLESLDPKKNGNDREILRAAICKTMTDEQMQALVERLALYCVEEAAKTIAREIRDSMDLKEGGPRLGRPKKYKTHKGAEP